MNVKQRQLAGLFGFVVALVLVPALAIAGNGKLLDETGCACCPVCDHVCKLDVEETEVKRTCFKIETKVVCIPRVVFPWQKAKKAACASCDSCDGRGCQVCVHNGARVRKVCVAKPDSYKCPACKYTWSAEKKDTCAGCAAMVDEPVGKETKMVQAQPAQRPFTEATKVSSLPREPWATMQLEPVMVEPFDPKDQPDNSVGLKW